MSIGLALSQESIAGTLPQKELKDLHHSCCSESSLEVYDFDAYARIVEGGRPAQPLATVDGVWAGEIEDRSHLVLIEMKSIQSMELNFHFQECAKDVRGSTHEETAQKCQVELKAFMKRKIQEFDFESKLYGTQDLLCGLDAQLTNDLEKGDVSERCLVACDLDYRDFIAYRNTFRAALRPLKNEVWGEPTAIPCARIKDEQALRGYVAAG